MDVTLIDSITKGKCYIIKNKMKQENKNKGKLLLKILELS